MAGEELWISELLQGLPSGTPKVSKEGDYVFVTHNSDSEAVGHFTVLDAGTNGTTFFSQTNNNAPFAPPGIYHSPKEGYYTGGENNRNDVLVWSVQPKKNDTNVGLGATFGFQFPIGFLGEPDNLSYTNLGQALDFQAIAPPVFGNGGLSMYWGTTRSQFRAWVGQEGFNRYRFNLNRTAAASFTRGVPPMQAVYAPLALSDDSSKPFAFGGTAAEEFVRLNFDFSEQLQVVTSSIVKTKAHISPDNLYVYYVEFYGKIHQARFDDLSDNWVHDLQVPVDGEFALTADGSNLYVADVTGKLSGFRIASAPTSLPTVSPTGVPGGMGTNLTTSSPMAANEGLATEGPTKMPARAPTSEAAPTLAAPTAAPEEVRGGGGATPVASTATLSAGYRATALMACVVAAILL
jgi:hypothetical protein